MTSLAFPCGVAPGFDPAQIAAALTRFSGVARGGNFVDLLTGKPGAITGTPIGVMDGVIGPTTKYFSSTDISAFAGKPAGSFTAYTFGAIFVPDTLSTTQFLVNSSSSSTGAGLVIAPSGGFVPGISFSGVASFSMTGSNLSVGVPYFAAASIVKDGANFSFGGVLTNLNTGGVLTNTQTGVWSAAGADTGTCGVGSRGSLPANSHLSAGMFSNAFVPLAGLRQWAADPWSFWYPNK